MWCNWNGMPLHGATGGVSKIMASDLLSGALSISAVFMAVLDAETGRYVEVNEAFCRLVGSTREELLGSIPSVLNLLSKAKRTRKSTRDRPHRFEAALRTRTGEVRHVIASMEAFEADGTGYLAVSGMDVTSRRRLERSLTEIAGSFRAIFENAAVGIAQVDPTGRILLSNAHLCRMLGYEPGKLDGMGIWELMHPEDVDRQFTEMEQLVSGAAPTISMEQRFITRDGRPIWVLASISMVRDGSGRAVYSIGVLSDITDRKLAEHELRRSREEFSKIFRVTPFLMLISTVEEGRLMEVNRAFEEVMGYPREHVLGKRSDELGLWVDPSEREHLKRLLLEQGRFTNQLMRVRRSNGEERVMLVSGEPMKFRGKQCVLGGAQDITEERRSTEALRRSEEKFRALFENSPFGVLITTPDGTIHSANPAACAMFELSEKQILALGRSGILDTSDQRLAAALEERRREGRIQGKELTAIRKGGDRFPVEIDSVILSKEPAWSFVILRDITERKRAEQKQREVEEKFSKVFRNAPIPTSLSRLDDGTLVDVNAAWSDMFGIQRSQALGKTPAQLGLSANAEQRDRLFAELREKRSIRNLEVTWYRTRSNKNPVLLANLETMELGGERFVFTTVQDITERKEAEEAVRKSEEKFRAVFEGAIEAIYVHDLEGRFLDVNEKSSRLSGYSKAELLRMTASDLDAEKDKVPHRFEVLTKEGSLSFETLIVRKDGTRLPVEINTQIIQYGEKPAILGVVRDVSERKRSETALKESEEKFRAVFEGAVESILVHDFDGRLLDFNRRSHERLGYTREEMRHLDLGHIDSPEKAATISERMELLRRDDSLTFESVHVRKDGSTFPVEVTAQILHYGGRPAILSVVRDITERKLAEEKLRKLANSLEDRVRERTLELERANRAKDEFLANMSHEIRTPVGEVIGMTDVLLKRDIPATIRNDLRIIRRSSETILTLVNDLLDLSRIEYGKLELDVRPFTLREMLEPLVRPFESMAREKGLEFGLTIGEDVPEMINCDPDRLGQVLKNLLTNALKFTEQGSISLSVVLDRDTKHFVRLRFCVADTGIGIPASKRARIFMPFSQLDPSYSKRFAGVGLGLAISKRLVELMGGEISVEGAAGKGSTFLFTIVVAKTAQAPIKEPAARPHLADLPPLSILLVEDNPVNRLFLRRALTDAGHTVEEAENGVQALGLNARKRFDLILMDIQMPEMDGTEAARLIRSGKHGRRDVPVIALTAYAMKGDRERFLSAGMDGYVAKPVDFDELAGAMADAIGTVPEGSD
jgi:PAS domain S-box-containing protein